MVFGSSGQFHGRGQSPAELQRFLRRCAGGELLLQHRGHILMGAGHSIAVQNFNENLSILIMTGLYYLMIKANMSIYWVVTLFGLFVSSLMYLIRQRHLANQRDCDDVAHLDDSAH